mgnify:CR=1 FL=1
MGARMFHAQATAHVLDSIGIQMAEGTVKRKTDKGFGFIDDGSGKDMFFHTSALEGIQYDELREGQRVSYNVGEGPKGPRAENVRVI